MIFSSPIFLFLFLPIILSVYFLAPRSARNTLLLVASLFFYLWGEKLYVAVLVSSIAANYCLGLLLERFGDLRRAANALIALGVLVNLGLLVTYKYANFLIDNLNLLFDQIALPRMQAGHVHLPLGISFFTFHALSYVIDVYRREVRALKSPVDFALYISFFPQSIAGPIIRYHDVAGQLGGRTETRERFVDGIRRFIIGLAKKMLLANTMAGPADAIFNLPTVELTPGLAWLGVICYTLQIYFDFAGYSDMAIGLAKMFGFEFKENFNYPYIAQSITDFWRRWHISLSTWYRDYLYIPLGGNRRGDARTYFNLLTVFVLCGFWHGASWTFLLWGLFHGAFLVLERTRFGNWLALAPAPIRHGYTLAVVMVGWTFFRALTLSQALAFLKAMAGYAPGSGLGFYPGLYLNDEVVLLLVAGILCSLPILPVLVRGKDAVLASLGERGVLAAACHGACAIVPAAALLFLLGVSAMLLAAGTYNPFIYFHF